MQRTKENRDQRQKKKKHPPRKPTPTEPGRANTEPGTSDDDEKKKKTGAGQCLGVGEEEDVRIEGGERVQVEETQGEPQTKKVWASPAPERERERTRTRTHGVDEQTIQEKEEDRQIEAKHGSGREGLNGPENKHRPLRNNNGFTTNRQKPDSRAKNKNPT